MTGTVTLFDGGQNYIEFDIVNNVIQEVRPALLAGWKGTRILNTKFVIGGKINFDLQWKDYNPVLKHAIMKKKSQLTKEKTKNNNFFFIFNKA